jgi:alanine racemase
VWAEIDLNAIRGNVAAVRRVLTKGCRYQAVVKANAYGHGDVASARAALEGGAEWLGVILLEEARRLRDAGIDAPILLLHEPRAADAAEVLGLEITPSVFTRGGIEALGDAADRAGRTVGVHLKVDTGLNRLGASPALLDDVATALSKERGLEVEAVFSHFAIADPPDHPFIAEQTQRFAEVIDRLARLGFSPAMRHIGNSATALSRPEAHMDMVRVGIATYGIAPAASLADVVPLSPAMTLKAEVAMVKRVPAGEGISYGLTYRLERPSTIATLPLGYADGWPRHAAGRTHVLIGGRRYPAVGTVCMDSFMVDLGDDECEISDEAVLIGAQGSERITADELAVALGTISYEVVTGITTRVERIPVA